MSFIEELSSVAEQLPPGRQTQLLEYAHFLEGIEEREAWFAAGRQNLRRAYSDNEPEYTPVKVSDNP